MALNLVKDSAPRYTALSTDIVDNKIAGAKYIGAIVYLTDTKKWKIINEDGTLSDYVLGTDAVLEVSDLKIGAVEIQDKTNDSRMSVNSDGSINIKLTDGTEIALVDENGRLLVKEEYGSYLVNIRMNGDQLNGYMTEYQNNGFNVRSAVKGTTGTNNTTQVVANTVLAGSVVTAIVVDEDAVFSQLAAASGYTLSGTMTGRTISAGTTIYGRFASYTLTSGAVTAYLGA
jgi:hypothetical protein